MDEHGEKTRQLFRSIALERAGYYDSKPGGPPKLSIWQRRIRRAAERVLDDRLESDRALTRLLDAGCGRGDFTRELASRYPRLERVHGCDFSPELIALAQATVESGSRIAFSTADLTALPFEPSSFDVTVCLNVLHHIREDRLRIALGELARVTTCTLVLEIKNADSLYFRRHSGTVEGVTVYPTTTDRVREHLQSTGFQLAGRRRIFGVERISPLVLLHFERKCPTSVWKVGSHHG